MASGFELALTCEEGEYGYGRYKNVVTSIQYERMLSATGPYKGHMVRPSNGKKPGRVAWNNVQYRRFMISQVYMNPENDNLVVETFDHIKNEKLEEEYDLVVLSTGFKPSAEWEELARRLNIRLNPYGFATVDFDEPVSTSRPGVFVCGAVEAPKDIPETVIQAGADAAEASTLLTKSGKIEETKDLVEPRKEAGKEAKEGVGPKVGVFVCH